MSLKKYIAIFAIINLLSLNITFAESANPIEAQYILKSKFNNWTYNIYLQNQPNSLSDLKAKISNWDYLSNINFKFSSKNLELLNFKKDSWKIAIEKFITIFEDWVATQTSDSITKDIEIRSLDSTYFIGNYSTYIFWEKTIYTIPINSNIEYPNFWDKIYELDIDWSVFPLEYDMWIYEEWKYYISKWQIKFLSKNIDKPISIIKLKIDWLYSNVISINKETIKLPKINSIEINQNFSVKDLRINIEKDNKLQNLNNIDLYINWVLSDIRNVVISWWSLIIKVDISTKIDDILELQLKDNTDNSYSNKIYINLAKHIIPKITKLDFWENYPNYKNFKFEMFFDVLFGSVYDFEVNLNWIPYTIDWIKELIINSNWETYKDIYGDDTYDTIQQIDLKKDWNSLYFNWLTNLLKDNNILYLTNKNYEKTSNTVYFSKDLKNINYNYSIWNINNKKESITYSKINNIQKSIDFLQTPEKDIKLGKISFNNLKNDSYYKISFNITSDSNINPLLEMKLSDENLETIKTNSWIIFNYEKNWYWKDFSEKELIFNINELFNLNKAINLKINNINIDLLDENSEFKNIYNDNTDKNISLDYKYNMSNCFDWEWDFCNALKLWWDSYMALYLSYWKILNKPTNNSKNISNSSSTNTNASINTNTKSNNYNTKNKLEYMKQLMFSKSALNKSIKLKKYIDQVDKIVELIDNSKSEKIISKIEKLDKTKLWTSKDIINYLEAKLVLKLLN